MGEKKKFPKWRFTKCHRWSSLSNIAWKNVLSHLRTGHNTKSNKKMWEKLEREQKVRITPVGQNNACSVSTVNLPGPDEDKEVGVSE